ncbi:YceI family protein [Flavobacterium sp. 14A]|uniref:YceI family protein n=1 Tax=Flavobacterium sp. 14A TaxID=2735896 RepID=UPI0020C6FA84|nr:YceI family protein [Flavobacterium sp. 14A]NRT13488.1 polyisoprenoid-binding protein YceI [Flavobacterium sp. 14A]
MAATLQMNTTKWSLNSNQSDVLIKARHSIIAYISGSLNKFKGSIDIHDNEVEDACVEFVLDIKNQESRLKNIDSPVYLNEYLDSNTFPNITFRSTSFQKISANINFLKGNLTVNNITKTVELDAQLVNITTQNGIRTAVFEVTGEIKRNDFNLNANAYHHTNGISLGQDISLIATLEFVI